MNSAKFLNTLRTGTLLLIVISAGLKLHLVFLQNINWDEFLFLSKIHRYLQGDTLSNVQSFYVHLFTWLPLFSKNEIAQIIFARCTVYVLSLISGFIIYKICKIFISTTSALVSVLCYFTFSNILIHGSSFRADPICVFLFLTAIYFILSKPFRTYHAIIAGICLSFSLLITIKTAFYIACIGLVFILQLTAHPSKTVTIKRFVVFSFALATSFIMFFNLHTTLLQSAPIKTQHTTIIFGKNTHRKVDLEFPKKIISRMFGNKLF